MNSVNNIHVGCCVVGLRYDLCDLCDLPPSYLFLNLYFALGMNHPKPL